jgi:hypothetical protein
MVRNTNVGKLRVPGTSLHTQALGAVVVHRITLGGVLRLGRRFPGLDAAGELDANAVADSILREVCRGQRVDGTAYTERELTQEDLTSLTPAERLAVVRAVCEAEGWDPSGLAPDELLVRGLRVEASSVRERQRVTSDDTRSAAGTADSVLSRETMAKLVHSAAQIEAVKASLELPDWLDQMKARQRLYDPQPLVSGNSASAMRPDLRLTEAGQQDAPLTRLVAASELHSRKLDGLAEAQRLSLQSQTDMNSTVLAAAQELAVRAHAWERRATIGYWVATGAIALSVLAALSQIYLSMRFKAASDQWQDRVEGVISEQRNELKALREQNQSLREQSERDNAALRDQLAKKATPPIAAPPAVAATPAPKATKPAPAAKHGQKAGR